MAGSKQAPSAGHDGDMTHSFIVKIWLEETVEEAGRAVWRGHITHVPSRERRYIQALEDIPAFIVPYLQRMGVKPGARLRLKGWLGKWRRSPT